MGFGDKRQKVDHLNNEDKKKQTIDQLINDNSKKIVLDEEEYKRVGTSVTIREDVLAEAKISAKQNRISFSRLVEDLLMEHLGK